MNRALLDCMKTLRHRLRDELTVDIRLSQPDAIEMLLMSCLRSSDRQTRELGIQLAGMTDFQATADTGMPQQKPLAQDVLDRPAQTVHQRIYA